MGIVSAWKTLVNSVGALGEEVLALRDFIRRRRIRLEADDVIEGDDETAHVGNGDNGSTPLARTLAKAVEHSRREREKKGARS